MAKRTDLAVELRENLGEDIEGISCVEKMYGSFKVTHVKILTEGAAQKIGKPEGNYITIETDGMNREDEALRKEAADLLSKELDKLINKYKGESVLVVGLGNRYITPDSIGPEAVKGLFVTRHLKGEKAFSGAENLPSVSAIAPGVLGLTGIETGEIVGGINEHIRPALIIAIDALAAQKICRLGTTIQLSDTGISPGSGVGNNRKELSQKSMGVPVIAIGVPMVVDAATLTDNVLDIMDEHAAIHSNGKIQGVIPALTQSERAAFVREALEDKNMIVTPNDADMIAHQAAVIIAEGINKALYDL